MISAGLSQAEDVSRLGERVETIYRKAEKRTKLQESLACTQNLCEISEQFPALFTQPLSDITQTLYHIHVGKISVIVWFEGKGFLHSHQELLKLHSCMDGCQ